MGFKCCPSGDESANTAITRQLLVMGITTGMSLCFLLAAGIRYSSEGGWLAMLNLLFVLALPFAAVITDTFGASQSWAGYDEKSAAWLGFGNCFLGLILVSLFALPLVLLHTGAIGGPVLGLWLTSTVLTAGASIWFAISRAQAKANAWS